MADRAALLGKIADEYMAGRMMPMPGYPNWPEGARSLHAEAWPHEQPREIHFKAEWPDITIVCSRNLTSAGMP